MKRRIIALILVMGLLAGMGVDGKMTCGGEYTGRTNERNCKDRSCRYGNRTSL